MHRPQLLRVYEQWIIIIWISEIIIINEISTEINRCHPTPSDDNMEFSDRKILIMIFVGRMLIKPCPKPTSYDDSLVAPFIELAFRYVKQRYRALHFIR